MLIKENLIALKKTLPKEVELVAVTKTKSIADIKEAYNTGHKNFGENKVQEMVNKHEELPKDIQWHMIGHLQRNKVKYMAHFVHLIHGVDSFKTLKEIDKQAKKHYRVINCLLQVRIVKEETKFGLTFNEIEQIIKNEELIQLKNIKIIGLMGMASFTDDTNQVNNEFRNLNNFFKKLKTSVTSSVVKKQNLEIKTLSMGMSGDYKIAIKNGSDMIRIGSAIFGARNYIT
ncbi:MAG: YggS family pyridoxal phosphate-dependent enzyme [Methanosarcinales archaeon]|nr:YggS family pyridoxal phosphate-dependent enzyme [Methanosarcinales archaeon]